MTVANLKRSCLKKRLHRPGDALQDGLYYGANWENVWYRWYRAKFFLESTRTYAEGIDEERGVI